MRTAHIIGANRLASRSLGLARAAAETLTTLSGAADGGAAGLLVAMTEAEITVANFPNMSLSLPSLAETGASRLMSAGNNLGQSERLGLLKQ